jgi:hypothetical protein
MPRTTKLVFNFLRELDSQPVQETFDSLGVLLDHLETKNDPDPVEVQVVDTAYQALEKLKMLEGLLKQYVGDSNILKGNKLAKLYEQTKSQSLFD